MNKKQIAVIVAIVIVTGYLCYLQPKPLAMAKPGSDKGTGSVASNTEKPNNASINVQMVSATAKTAIAQSQAAQITDLEGKLKNAATDADKLSLQKQLAKQWDNVHQPAPAAFYYQ